MGPGDAIAAVALFGFLIAVMIVVGSSIHRAIAYKQRKMELAAEQKRNDRGSARSDYIEQLEERVRVLERIATDREPDLARQIEALREPRSEETTR
jgi:hypothetical protein